MKKRATVAEQATQVSSPTALDEKSVKQFNKVFDERNLGLVGVSDELNQLKYAILTKEHFFIEGEPGTAKSMLAYRVFKSFDGAKLFSIHMSKETTDDALFGPVDVKEYKDNGRYIRKIDNSILDADFAFLDEMFDASEDTLRTLLSVLNERRWSRGEQIVNAKLHTAIATANYSNINEKTEAVVDRFIFKAKSKSKFSKDQMMKMFDNFLTEDKNKDFSPKITVAYEDVKKMSELVCSNNHITFPEEVRHVYYSLLEDFKTEAEKKISNRVANKCLNVAKASALLNGREEVQADDLKEMKFVLCTLNDKGKESAAFDASYGKAVAVLKIKDEIEEIKVVAKGIINTDIMKLNPGEMIKLVKGSKVYIKQIDNISKSAGKQLPKNYQDEVVKIRTELANKINSLQKEIDNITREAQAN